MSQPDESNAKFPPNELNANSTSHTVTYGTTHTITKSDGVSCESSSVSSSYSSSSSGRVTIAVQLEDGTLMPSIEIPVDELQRNEDGTLIWKGKVVRIV